MTPAFNRNHFELLGLPAAYAVDPDQLESRYRELQGRVHPDRFAAAPEAEKRLAMQWAARANEAYRTLRDPVDRARYILSLRGFDTGEETNTSRRKLTTPLPSQRATPSAAYHERRRRVHSRAPRGYHQVSP